MNVLDGQDTLVRRSNILNGLDSSKGSNVEDAIPKQSLLLLCSEKAAYIYSFTHVMQVIGISSYEALRIVEILYLIMSSYFSSSCNSGS